MEPIAVGKPRKSTGQVNIPTAAVRKLNPREGRPIYYAWDPEKEVLVVSLNPEVMA